MRVEAIQVVTTTAEKKDAETLAQAVLESRLAACVQVSGPIDSRYWWNGRLETAVEWLLTIKTRRDLYKQLERQHSQSGFTSLLLTFPILLQETTPQEVMAALARVKVADVNRWSQEHVPRTLAAKRRLMFREARTARKNSATQKSVAA